jgi:glycerol transport system permease protein
MRQALTLGALLLPALVVMGFVAVLPLLAVFNYSFHDIFSLDQAFWIGLDWYQEIVTSDRFLSSLARSLLFSGVILAIQIPLGIAFALVLVRFHPILRTLGLMLVALPLVVPWNMIPMIWLALVNPDTGLAGQAMAGMGWAFDYKFTALHTWALIVVMDTWHWIGLVVILACASLSAIPAPLYRAAAIDGASRLAVFRHIELPRLAGGLAIVLLLRFVDSFMIYTEAFAINAGGPNGATTFLSLDLGEDIKAYSYGSAAARAMLSFLVVVSVVWAFVKITTRDRGQA